MSGVGAGRRLIVAPYVTRWSEEVDLVGEVVDLPGVGIAYADELPVDRDDQGVLWLRVASRCEVGRPDFVTVHPLRQRRAMRRLLCQVCAGPADQAEDGVLWLLPDERDEWDGWPEGLPCPDPPICVSCAELAVRMCPALRRGGAAVVRVRRYPVIGVRGILYASRDGVPVEMGLESLAYESPAVRWVQATHLLRELQDCAIVPFDQLG